MASFEVPGPLMTVLVYFFTVVFIGDENESFAPPRGLGTNLYFRFPVEPEAVKRFFICC